MTAIAEVAQSKTHKGENFPVASKLISPRHRATILAFYRFARAADDVADHPRLSELEKLRGLDALEATLLGKSDGAGDALPLRAALAEKGLGARHPLDLLTAFRRDVTRRRYETWDDLIDYCRFSAMPVGRFVLDAHGESEDLWPGNDALCAALQIINHLQDCAKDYRDLDRVYVPLDALAVVGLDVGALAEPAASPALRSCLSALARKNSELLVKSAGFSSAIVDFRLGLEVAVIQRVGESLNGLLMRRDPLRDRVHFGKKRLGLIALTAAAGGAMGRLRRGAVRAGDSSKMASSGVAEGADAVRAVVKRSSFYVALRILPAAKRDAMYAIYAFCRAVDDVADEPGPKDARYAELANWRGDIDALYRGETRARTRGLEGPVRRFGLEREDFLAIIDGMEMDLAGQMRAPDRATLDLYCDRVASAPGRLSVRVFGMAPADGLALAHCLGRALQLTNILRDLDEDAEIGRLYLPREALAAAGIPFVDPRQAILDLRIGAACAPLAESARDHFRDARAIMARSPRAQVHTPLLMCEAYDAILRKLERRGFRPPRKRTRLSKITLVGLLLRHVVA